jgi:hypothetical protein
VPSRKKSVSGQVVFRSEVVFAGFAGTGAGVPAKRTTAANAATAVKPMIAFRMRMLSHPVKRKRTAVPIKAVALSTKTQRTMPPRTTGVSFTNRR